MPSSGLSIHIVMILLLSGLASQTALAQQPIPQAETTPALKARAKQEEAQRKLAAYKLMRADAQTQTRAKALRGRVATLAQELDQATTAVAKSACINGVVFMAFSLQEALKREEKLLALAKERAALHRSRQAHAKTQALIDALKALNVSLTQDKAPSPSSLERLTVDAEELIRLTHQLLARTADKPQARQTP